MRLAIILSLALDRRSGRVHGSDLLPADEAVTKVKQLITSGKPLDPRFPIVAAVSFSTLREHRFNVDSAELAAWKDGTIREASAEDLTGALEEAEKKLAESEASAKAAAEEMQRKLAESESRAKAADEALASVPADVLAAAELIGAIRAKLAVVNDKLKKDEILALVEEALAIRS